MGRDDEYFNYLNSEKVVRIPEKLFWELSERLTGRKKEDGYHYKLSSYAQDQLNREIGFVSWSDVLKAYYRDL